MFVIELIQNIFINHEIPDFVKSINHHYNNFMNKIVLIIAKGLG